jgi:ABC-type uncharacterized transport system permease subunit
MKKLVSIVLILLALALIAMGIANAMIPPVLTGVGFIAIAMVFFKENPSP